MSNDIRRRVRRGASRRAFLQSVGGTAVGAAAAGSGFLLGRTGILWGAPARDSAQREPAPPAGGPDYRIELSTAREGFDRRTAETCWAQSRAGVIPPGVAGNPGKRPLAIITTQPLSLRGSDVYYGIHDLRSADLGRTWSAPQPCPGLKRRRVSDEVQVALCDLTPKWHAASRRLLGTGHTAWYRGDRLMPGRPRETGHTAFDPATGEWSAWQTLAMPDRPEFKNAGAGCTQRIDLPDGRILLPVYFKRPGQRCSSVTVLRCRFDGTTLEYVEHGDELKHDVPRGFAEPSLTKFGDRFFLTLRNDVRGYVTSGPDGMGFDEPRPWTFDDGSELGNYNTQQHWVAHSDGLFLVYTRRGASNDHVFRHRAPLFIARVDPERLRVVRSTERVLVPERGTRIGNFGVTDVTPHETWVVTTEWMQPPGVEKHGSANRIYLARLHWNRPNRLFGGQ